MATADSASVRDSTVVAWRPVLWAACGVSLVLVIASWVTLQLLPHPFFAVGGSGHAYLNVGAEANVPTWWSTTLCTAGGLTFLAVGWLHSPQGRLTVASFWSVSVILLLFSLDELTMIHERLFRPAQVLVSADVVPFVWLVLGIPLALAIFAAVLVAARKLPTPTRGLVILGTAVFFAGAVGMESVASALHARGMGEGDGLVLAYHIEELLEMIGISVLLAAPLRSARLERSGSRLAVTARGMRPCMS